MASTTPHDTLQDGPPQLQLPVQHIVGRTRAWRWLAAALAIFLLLLPVLLAFVPWQQNVPGAGRVTALDPLNRVTPIPAPVSGRLVELRVREGTRVAEGEVLAVMEDLDPDFTARLDLQTQFARNKVEAAHLSLETLDAQLIQLQVGKDAALRQARADFHRAVEKVREAERKRDAEDAKAEFALLDFERQTRLLATGTTSEQKQQKAYADYKATKGAASAAKAVVEQARLERDAKEAAIDKIDAEQQAKIDEVKGKEQSAVSRLEDAKKALTEAEGAVARQSTQRIVAPRDGVVLRVFAATSSDVISRGEPLVEIVPDADQLAVEIWMRGIDAPLVTIGRKARLQFEGWPAVQFAAWPSVAVGTFGGTVAQVDAQAAADGRVRVMIVPDPDEAPWPEERFLRQGVRVSGWIQLETVSSGYEIWRQLNAFPPTVRNGAPPADGGSMGEGSAGKSATGKGDGTKAGGKTP